MKILLVLIVDAVGLGGLIAGHDPVTQLAGAALLLVALLVPFMLLWADFLGPANNGTQLRQSSARRGSRLSQR